MWSYNPPTEGHFEVWVPPYYPHMCVALVVGELHWDPPNLSSLLRCIHGLKCHNTSYPLEHAHWLPEGRKCSMFLLVLKTSKVISASSGVRNTKETLSHLEGHPEAPKVPQR